MTRPERELHEKLVRAEADFLARKKAMTKQLRAAEASATVAQSDCQAAWEAQNAMDEENRTLRSRCKASEDREESIEAKEREVDKALLEHMGIATKLAELKLAWEDEKEKVRVLMCLESIYRLAALDIALLWPPRIWLSHALSNAPRLNLMYTNSSPRPSCPHPRPLAPFLPASNRHPAFQPSCWTTVVCSPSSTI
jgi:hypothetical protein